MTDQELLRLCRDAFAATTTASNSRKFLKNLGTEKAQAYAGTGQQLLAEFMRRLINDHLEKPCE